MSAKNSLKNPKVLFTDSHCHIHDSEFFPDGSEDVYERSLEAGVERIICVGTSIRSSHETLDYAGSHDGVYASFGIHPHDSELEAPLFDDFRGWCLANKTEKVVAIGEIGLDYHYMHSPRQSQIDLFEKQLDLALELNLPVSFHVREAFEDFWPIIDNFRGIRGVLHSFTDTRKNMEIGLEHNLSIGVNGITTFSTDLQKVIEAVPLDKILLETDAPYLTPRPFRGKMNEPGNIVHIASYVAEFRGITVEELSQMTEATVTGIFF